MNTETLTALTAHNLLPARDLIGGQRYADTFICSAKDAEIELFLKSERATTPGAIRFAIGVTIGAGNNGHISPEDTMDMLDYLCAKLAA